MKVLKYKNFMILESVGIFTNDPMSPTMSKEQFGEKMDINIIELEKLEDVFSQLDDNNFKDLIENFEENPNFPKDVMKFMVNISKVKHLLEYVLLLKVYLKILRLKLN